MESESLFQVANARVEKLRQMAHEEESRNAHWRTEAVLRFDAALLERLLRQIEDVRGDIYLWQIGEIDAEKALTAIRDTLALS